MRVPWAQGDTVQSKKDCCSWTSPGDKLQINGKGEKYISESPGGCSETFCHLLNLNFGLKNILSYFMYPVFPAQLQFWLFLNLRASLCSSQDPPLRTLCPGSRSKANCAASEPSPGICLGPAITRTMCATPNKTLSDSSSISVMGTWC